MRLSDDCVSARVGRADEAATSPIRRRSQTAPRVNAWIAGFSHCEMEPRIASLITQPRKHAAFGFLLNVEDLGNFRDRRFFGVAFVAQAVEQRRALILWGVIRAFHFDQIDSDRNDYTPFAATLPYS